MKLLSSFLFSLMTLCVVSAGPAQAANGQVDSRDQCFSNLRGLAEMNAAKGGYELTKLDKGEYRTTSDGETTCWAQFLTSKNGEAGRSPIYEGTAQSDCPPPETKCAGIDLEALRKSAESGQFKLRAETAK